MLLISMRVNPRSLFQSNAFFKTESRQIMKRKGASVSPCKTPPDMFRNSVSPSSDLTIDLECVYAIMIALIISSGIPYELSISAIFLRCMESKVLENR